MQKLDLVTGSRNELETHLIDKVKKIISSSTLIANLTKTITSMNPQAPASKGSITEFYGVKFERVIPPSQYSQSYSESVYNPASFPFPQNSTIPPITQQIVLAFRELVKGERSPILGQDNVFSFNEAIFKSGHLDVDYEGQIVVATDDAEVINDLYSAISAKEKQLLLLETERHRNKFLNI